MAFFRKKIMGQIKHKIYNMIYRIKRRRPFKRSDRFRKKSVRRHYVKRTGRYRTKRRSRTYSKGPFNPCRYGSFNRDIKNYHTFSKVVYTSEMSLGIGIRYSYGAFSGAYLLKNANFSNQEDNPHYRHFEKYRVRGVKISFAPYPYPIAGGVEIAEDLVCAPLYWFWGWSTMVDMRNEYDDQDLRRNFRVSHFPWHYQSDKKGLNRSVYIKWPHKRFRPKLPGGYDFWEAGGWMATNQLNPPACNETFYFGFYHLFNNPGVAVQAYGHMNVTWYLEYKGNKDCLGYYRQPGPVLNEEKKIEEEKNEDELIESEKEGSITPKSIDKICRAIKCMK